MFYGFLLMLWRWIQFCVDRILDVAFRFIMFRMTFPRCMGSSSSCVLLSDSVAMAGVGFIKPQLSACKVRRKALDVPGFTSSSIAFRGFFKNMALEGTAAKL